MYESDQLSVENGDFSNCTKCFGNVFDYCQLGFFYLFR